MSVHTAERCDCFSMAGPVLFMFITEMRIELDGISKVILVTSDDLFADDGLTREERS
jgi:hypothetical protein